MIRIDFMIDDEDNDALIEISKRDGMSKSWLIRKSIKEFLKTKNIKR